MNANSLYWMNYSISISKESPQSNLQVGVVLVSERNDLICSAFAGEERNVSWCSVLLSKVRKLKLDNARSIYITINTMSAIESFDLNELLKEVNIHEIYMGLPDPALTAYLDNDPTMPLNHVYRYPDELQREILEQNSQFFADSKQSIKYSPYYFENRISNFVIEKLQLKGFIISKNELNANKRKAALASLICNKYGIEASAALSVVHNAISESFNNKYGAYNYSDDIRSLDLGWKEYFMYVYMSSYARPMSSINILNVGVGDGQEAIALFSNCMCVTFVDIAQSGLRNIKEQLPSAKVIVSSADDLSFIPDNSYELYVSLRTFNSSFFEIKEALLEAHRVLKPNAAIIISVANGFLCPERYRITPGLIIPGTEFVDIYRGMNTTKLIHAEFSQAGFKNIQLFLTNTEIYLSAITT